MNGPTLPAPGQRVSAIAIPASYVLPGRPEAAAPTDVQEAHRQTGFVLGADLRLFATGMNAQLGILAASSHSRYRTPVYAAVVSAWSRAYAALGDACLLVMRGSYGTVPNLVRSACELIAAEQAVKQEETDEFISWMLGHLKPDEEHKAFDVGLGHYFPGGTLASDPLLRPVYRVASDLGRPNFGATLLEVGPESNNQRLAFAFDDASFHVGWAEIELGWLLRLCERQIAVAVHMPDVLNISAETHESYTRYASEVQAYLDASRRAQIAEVERDGFKRWLIHNFRRQPSAAPKKILL